MAELVLYVGKDMREPRTLYAGKSVANIPLHAEWVFICVWHIPLSQFKTVDGTGIFISDLQMGDIKERV